MGKNSVRAAVITAALAVALLTGCTIAGPPQAAAPPPVVAAQSGTAVAIDKTPDNYLAAVQHHWMGDSPMPDKQWLLATATLICKQIINGDKPRVELTGDYYAKNEYIVAYYARTMVCETN